ncbi:hypothetical protein B0H19DRAFT_1202957 [Mycena capillaripes]|nr:hypothetical protein B0H19DRAFT_1202957 [Mycena capillaripes]
MPKSQGPYTILIRLHNPCTNSHDAPHPSDMPVVQRITFPVSEAFSSDPNIFKAATDIVKTSGGYISSFHGLQIEDKKTGYFVTVWQSSVPFNAFAEGTTYTNFMNTLQRAASGDVESHYVDVNAADPSIPLSAPVTEFVKFTVKKGIQSGDTYDLFERLTRGLDAAGGAHPPSYWGSSRNSPGNHILVYVGWDTVEAHWEAVKEGTELHGIVQELLKQADVHIGHALLVKAF